MFYLCQSGTVLGNGMRSCVVRPELVGDLFPHFSERIAASMAFDMEIKPARVYVSPTTLARIIGDLN